MPKAADSIWSFNLRSDNPHDYSDYESDGSNLADNLPSDGTTLVDQPLSEDTDTAAYKPNPWSIAKINAASRMPHESRLSGVQNVNATGAVEKKSEKKKPQGRIVDLFDKQAKQPPPSKGSGLRPGANPQSLRSGKKMQMPQSKGDARSNCVSTSLVNSCLSNTPGPSEPSVNDHTYWPNANGARDAPASTSYNISSFVEPFHSVSKLDLNGPPLSASFRPPENGGNGQTSSGFWTLGEPHERWNATETSAASYPGTALSELPRAHTDGIVRQLTDAMAPDTPIHALTSSPQDVSSEASGSGYWQHPSLPIQEVSSFCSGDSLGFVNAAPNHEADVLRAYDQVAKAGVPNASTPTNAGLASRAGVSRTSGSQTQSPASAGRSQASPQAVNRIEPIVSVASSGPVFDSLLPIGLQSTFNMLRTCSRYSSPTQPSSTARIHALCRKMSPTKPSVLLPKSPFALPAQHVLRTFLPPSSSTPHAQHHHAQAPGAPPIITRFSSALTTTTPTPRGRRFRSASPARRSPWPKQRPQACFACP
ncbi:hypothetical protein BC834DRAFT_889063 [Gloeopeniophorella convolvens]|nr:hypothetical protein BC834DRAFT_889063 [Gloeopeniophorella convolvens]